jgi:hypothetical protein
MDCNDLARRIRSRVLGLNQNLNVGLGSVKPICQGKLIFFAIPGPEVCGDR